MLYRCCLMFVMLCSLLSCGGSFSKMPDGKDWIIVDASNVIHAKHTINTGLLASTGAVVHCHDGVTTFSVADTGLSPLRNLMSLHNVSVVATINGHEERGTVKSITPWQGGVNLYKIMYLFSPSIMSRIIDRMKDGGTMTVSIHQGPQMPVSLNGFASAWDDVEEFCISSG